MKKSLFIYQNIRGEKKNAFLQISAETLKELINFNNQTHDV